MNYYEHSKKGKRGTGLYILVALALILVGVLAWFAVSRNMTDADPNSSSEMMPSDDSSYTDDSSSYNATPPDNDSAGGVDTTVSDVPYSSETESEETPSESEPKSAPIMPIEGEIVKEYSSSSLQYSATYDDLRLHTGVDILADTNSAVKSSADGIVTATDESASLGKTVTIDHGNGIIFKYCGLENISVTVGDKVEMGAPFATVGTIPSECADKPHLHLEAVKNSESVSPLEIIGKIPE